MPDRSNRRRSVRVWTLSPAIAADRLMRSLRFVSVCNAGAAGTRLALRPRHLGHMTRTGPSIGSTVSHRCLHVGQNRSYLGNFGLLWNPCRRLGRLRLLLGQHRGFQALDVR